MTELAAAPPRIRFNRDRLVRAVKPHSRALILACLATASILVWMIPVAPETRCTLAKQAAMSKQAVASLAIALTTLSWYFHKPLLRRFSAIRERLAR